MARQGITMIYSDDDPTAMRAYARLCVAYRASGHMGAYDPAEAARWAYAQALPFVSPATAERIAAAVLAAGQARAAGPPERALSATPSARPAPYGQLQCVQCGAHAPLKAPPAGWMRVENLHREGRRASLPIEHTFCSAACAAAWFAAQVPGPAPGADPSPPPTDRVTQPPRSGILPAPRATPGPAPAPRRSVRVVRS